MYSALRMYMHIHHETKLSNHVPTCLSDLRPLPVAFGCCSPADVAKASIWVCLRMGYPQTDWFNGDTDDNHWNWRCPIRRHPPPFGNLKSMEQRSMQHRCPKVG